MADSTETGSESGTDSGSAETSQTQSETHTEQSGTSGGSNAPDPVAAAIEGMNTSVKGLTELVAKLPETLANLVKVEDKEAPAQTEGTPGGKPPEEKTEQVQSTEPKQSSGGWFSDWYYGKKNA